MARKTQDLEHTEHDRNGEARDPAIALDKIGALLDASFKQSHSDDEAENRKRRDYETEELRWTKLGAKAAIVFSFFSVILSGLTLVVLDKTLGVYRGQASIMATQAQITIATNEPILSATMRIEQSHPVLRWQNIGHASAKNVRVFVAFSMTNGGDLDCNYSTPKSRWTLAQIKALHAKMREANREELQSPNITPERVQQLAIEERDMKAVEDSAADSEAHQGAGYMTPDIPVGAPVDLPLLGVTGTGAGQIATQVCGHYRYDFGANPTIRTYDYPFCFSYDPANGGSVVTCRQFQKNTGQPNPK